jgi:thiamine biosynthesis lipoprotein
VTVRTEPMWGTTIRVEVCDTIRPTDLDGIFDWFRDVDSMFSTWREDSEVSRLAAGTLRLTDASSDVRRVLVRCDEASRRSGGAFDIAYATHPDVQPAPGRCPIDPSGFVKGWALDHAADLLTGRGMGAFSINAGGDIITRGRPRPDRGWRIGIQHPEQRHAVAAVIEIDDGAVATSARYERGEHILDPRTGEPAVALSSVTVVGADLADADADATAAMVLGEDGPAWLASLPDVEALCITTDQRVVTTEGFARYRIDHRPS